MTLIILWVLITVVFFGSLAFAASQPIPPIDREALINDPSLQHEFQMDLSSEPELAFASAKKFETVAG